MNNNNKRLLQAKVISTNMQKSIVVNIVKLVKHPIYKKYVKKSIRLHVHDEDNVALCGDTINIVECRPLSKTKSWKLVNIINRDIYK